MGYPTIAIRMSRSVVRARNSIANEADRVLALCAASVSLCCMSIGFIWVCVVYICSAVALSPSNREEFQRNCSSDYLTLYLSVSMCTFIALGVALITSTWLNPTVEINRSTSVCVLTSILKKLICGFVAVVSVVMAILAIVGAGLTKCNGDISSVNQSYLAAYFWVLTYLTMVPISVVVYRYRTIS